MRVDIELCCDCALGGGAPGLSTKQNGLHEQSPKSSRGGGQFMRTTIHLHLPTMRRYGNVSFLHGMLLNVAVAACPSSLQGWVAQFIDYLTAARALSLLRPEQQLILREFRALPREQQALLSWLLLCQIAGESGGYGSCFVLDLPAAGNTITSSSAAAAQPESVGNSRSLGPLRRLSDEQFVAPSSSSSPSLLSPEAAKSALTGILSPLLQRGWMSVEAPSHIGDDDDAALNCALVNNGRTLLLTGHASAFALAEGLRQSVRDLAVLVLGTGFGTTLVRGLQNMILGASGLARFPGPWNAVPSYAGTGTGSADIGSIAAAVAQIERGGWQHLFPSHGLVIEDNSSGVINNDVEMHEAAACASLAASPNSNSNISPSPQLSPQSATPLGPRPYVYFPHAISFAQYRDARKWLQALKAAQLQAKKLAAKVHKEEVAAQAAAAAVAAGGSGGGRRGARRPGNDTDDEDDDDEDDEDNGRHSRGSSASSTSPSDKPYISATAPLKRVLGQAIYRPRLFSGTNLAVFAKNLSGETSAFRWKQSETQISPTASASGGSSSSTAGLLSAIAATSAGASANIGTSGNSSSSSSSGGSDPLASALYGNQWWEMPTHGPPPAPPWDPYQPLTDADYRQMHSYRAPYGEPPLRLLPPPSVLPSTSSSAAAKTSGSIDSGSFRAAAGFDRGVTAAGTSSSNTSAAGGPVCISRSAFTSEWLQFRSNPTVYYASGAVTAALFYRRYAHQLLSTTEYAAGDYDSWTREIVVNKKTFERDETADPAPPGYDPLVGWVPNNTTTADLSSAAAAASSSKAGRGAGRNGSGGSSSSSSSSGNRGKASKRGRSNRRMVDNHDKNPRACYFEAARLLYFVQALRTGNAPLSETLNAGYVVELPSSQQPSPSASLGLTSGSLLSAGDDVGGCGGSNPAVMDVDRGIRTPDGGSKKRKRDGATAAAAFSAVGPLTGASPYGSDGSGSMFSFVEGPPVYVPADGAGTRPLRALALQLLAITCQLLGELQQAIRFYDLCLGGDLSVRSYWFPLSRQAVELQKAKSRLVGALKKAEKAAGYEALDSADAGGSSNSSSSKGVFQSPDRSAGGTGATEDRYRVIEMQAPEWPLVAVDCNPSRTGKPGRKPKPKATDAAAAVDGEEEADTRPRLGPRTVSLGYSVIAASRMELGFREISDLDDAADAVNPHDDVSAGGNRRLPSTALQLIDPEDYEAG